MTPEQQLLFDQLTELQQRIATGVLAGMTQRAAYLAAGGKATSESAIDSSCSEILRNLQVKAFMDSMKAQAVSKAVMSRDEILARLSLIARTGITDIVRFKTANIGKDMETGEDINQTAWTIDEDLQDSDPDKLASIFELEVGKNGPKIKMHNSVQAMAQIAKMQGYEAASKHEIAGPGGGPILTKDVSDLSDEALLALIAGDAS